MKNIACRFWFGICLTLLFGVTAAEETFPPPKADKKANSFLQDPIALAVFAEELVSYGEGKKDPLALLIAAKIKKGVGSSSEAELQALVNQAKLLADENEDVLKLVAQAEKSLRVRTRAPVDSSLKKIVGSVPPGGVFTQNLAYRGGEYTILGLLLDTSRIGDRSRNDYDLDLYVRSEQGGATICSMEGPGIPEKCAWTPARTGNFVIDLVNRTKLETPFVMLFR
jgi:hypothetical protein